jgi:hypothetical protein
VASFCRLPISGLLKNERNRLLRARQQLTERLAKKREITKLLILRGPKSSSSEATCPLRVALQCGTLGDQREITETWR